MAAPAAGESVAASVRRIRMKYRKGGAVRFLSHLDLLRAIERGVRRSGVQAWYTEGYHSRIRMSFSAALSLGLESEAEWLDLDVLGTMAVAEVVIRLNQSLPSGLEVLEAREIRIPSRTLGDLISVAVWRLENSGMNREDAGERIRAFESSEQVCVLRKGKKRDVKPFVHSIEVTEGGFCLVTRFVQAGSIKPDEVLEALGYEAAARSQFRVTRVAQLCGTGPDWTEPWDTTHT